METIKIRVGINEIENQKRKPTKAKAGFLKKPTKSQNLYSQQEKKEISLKLI